MLTSVKWVFKNYSIYLWQGVNGSKWKYTPCLAYCRYSEEPVLFVYYCHPVYECVGANFKHNIDAFILSLLHFEYVQSTMNAVIWFQEYCTSFVTA